MCEQRVGMLTRNRSREPDGTPPRSRWAKAPAARD